MTKIWNLYEWLMESGGCSVTVRGIILLLFVLLNIALSYFWGCLNLNALIAKWIFKTNLPGGKYWEESDLFRSYRWKGLIPAVLCNLLKGYLIVWVGRILYGTDGGALSSFFVVFGCLFPITSKGKGSTSLTVFFGTVFALSPLTALFLLFVFLIVTIGTRYLCLGVSMTAFLYPLFLRAFANSGLNVAFAGLTMIFIVFVYRNRLKALYRNEEEKIYLLSYLKRGSHNE